ncbi:MAG: PH domain-containing protein, partial [Halobacteriales archaeon]
QQREIPVGRIQNVDAQQSALQRVLGLAVVRFETAGGGETEAVLRLVDRSDADRLRSELRRYKERDEADTSDPGEITAPSEATTPAAGAGDGRARDTVGGARRPDESETVLFALSNRDLLILSALTFRWGVLPLGLLGVPIVGDRVVDAAAPALRDAVMGNLSLLAVGLFAAGVVGVVAVAWLASAAITFLNYYGFRLSRVGDELVYERGLVQRYSGSIPLEKIQTLTVEENVLMRQFGYAALTVETAGYAPGGDGGSGGRVPSAVPLADRAAVGEFIASLEGVERLDVERPPKRARRRFAGRYALVALGGTALLAGVDAFAVPLGWLWALPLAGLVVAPAAAHLKWRNLGHRAGDRHFLGRSGFWRRTTRVVPYYRVQTVVTERTVFQRRWDLASVVADTAASAGLLGRDATAHDVDNVTADDVHARLREHLQWQLAERRGRRT